MEKQIFKYVLSLDESQKVHLRIGAEILTVQEQNQQVCLWALVDPTAKKELRTIEIFGTGHAIIYGMGVRRKYIATFQLSNGFVGHAFEYTEVKRK